MHKTGEKKPYPTLIEHQKPSYIIWFSGVHVAYFQLWRSPGESSAVSAHGFFESRDLLENLQKYGRCTTNINEWPALAGSVS